MAIDPLAPATRSARKILLATALLSITYKAFDVTIDKIPIGGLAINFDNKLFSFLLAVVLCYSLCTFALYYFIDIRNFETTVHQTGVERAYSLSQSQFSDRFQRKVLKKILRQLPPEVFATATQNFADVLSGLERGRDESTRILGGNFVTLVKKASVDYTHAIDKQNPKHGDLYEMADNLVRTEIPKYEMQRKLSKYIGLPKLYAIRATYVFRNLLLDGIFPLVAGLTSLLALFEVQSFSWLQKLVP